MQLKKTIIPTRVIGPVKIVHSATEEVSVPLATFETPLWASVSRGAKISRLTAGIRAVIVSDCMTRSVLLEANDVFAATKFVNELSKQRVELEKITAAHSRFTKLKDWHVQLVGNLIYLRFSFVTGDAAGHNMATKAAEVLLDWILVQYPELQYVSISGNYCVDKKNSAVNGILGRGKYVIAEILIPKNLCQKVLRTTAQQVTALNVKKNLLGSIVSGGVRTANAHFANMLLALYLATGQDVANIVEGSQGFTYAEDRDGDLYFSVTLPNVIVGVVGAGKDLDFVRDNLGLLGCTNTKHSAQRLALIVGAVVLCGELSLLAAQTNRHELVRTHVGLERKNQK